MTTFAIVARCLAVVMVFAAFGLLVSITSNYSREDLIATVLNLAAMGLSIAICLAGGSLLLRGLRSGILAKLWAFVLMFGCSVIAVYLPVILVEANGYSVEGHPPIGLAAATFVIGLCAFLLFGFKSSFIRRR